MNEVTRVLEAVGRGEQAAAARLLPLVYDELRRLAAARLAQEAPGHTLDATALVHEAYLRVAADPEQQFDNRRHFFGAAAEAMRRILLDNARRKAAEKHGGGLTRHDAHDLPIAAPEVSHPKLDLLDLNQALDQFAEREPQMAQLVKLRFFAGLTNDQAAATLNISPATATRWWEFSRAWLFGRMTGEKLHNP